MIDIQDLPNGNAIIRKLKSRIVITPREQDILLSELQVRCIERCLKEVEEEKEGN